jgi:glutamyl-tRNA synthetase
MTVRTRVAPSPTGAPHIGTAYIALFNYAFAKHHGGSFVLRIEDTDQSRSTPESEQAIFDALRWVGIPWDEGPDVGGAHGPYRQSERFEIYRAHAATLVERGAAYPCFCTAQRLTELRTAQEAAKENIGYDGLCAGLAPAEVAARIAAGESHVIRLKVPDEGECVFTDRLRGEVRIPWQTVDDQVLVKSDGFPTYHLANVVDDHLMEITHVIRGEEWISSAPKHMMLYQAFGWTPPELVHMPLLRNPDKSKLSKRKNPTSILYYQRAGFLPEAVINFLGLMAYSPADGEETFTLQKMTEMFDIDRVSPGGPIFDLQKLTAFNGRYIRELSPPALLARLKEWMLNDEQWTDIVGMAQPRLNQLSDLVPMSSYLFADRIELTADDLTGCVPEPTRAAELLRLVQWEIEKTGPWDEDVIRAVFERVAELEELPLKKLLALFFVAISGRKVSLPIFQSMVVLGRDLSLRRLHYALDILAGAEVGLKGKKLKKFTKDYEYRYGKRD